MRERFKILGMLLLLSLFIFPLYGIIMLIPGLNVGVELAGDSKWTRKEVLRIIKDKGLDLVALKRAKNVIEYNAHTHFDELDVYEFGALRNYFCK